MKTYFKYLLLIFFLFPLISFGQDGVIELSNPSFGGDPRPGKEPLGWYDCGGVNFPEETPPDVHPANNEPAFGVTKTAFHGDTYLGMVVRENESWESVAQRLITPLRADTCYSFSIYLCTSETYISFIRGTIDELDFTTPIKLRIWGGKGYCRKDELLAESELIENTDWEKFSFVFQPKNKVNYITLEAFFQTPTFDVPNGNILLDNASSIVPTSCKD